MGKRLNYAQRMSMFENDRDFHDWKRALETSINLKDYDKFEDLVVDGIQYEYNFPLITDPRAKQIMGKYNLPR